MISLIIPAYRNPECLDICLKSAIQNQKNKNEIIVVVDGYVEESEDVLKKYKDDILVLEFPENRGLQTALNLGVYNASNSTICIVNEDNIFCENWDVLIEEAFDSEKVMTINQIEPKGPSIFNFKIHDYGKTPDAFDYEKFIDEEPSYREDKVTEDGGIFPFVISKKNYMKVGGFDTLYGSPFICDWDFFLKLQLSGVKFYRTYSLNLYHFGSMSTKKTSKAREFSHSENEARKTFAYKWGMNPQLFKNNLHGPVGKTIKGISYE